MIPGGKFLGLSVEFLYNQYIIKAMARPIINGLAIFTESL